MDGPRDLFPAGWGETGRALARTAALVLAAYVFYAAVLVAATAPAWWGRSSGAIRTVLVEREGEFVTLTVRWGQCAPVPRTAGEAPADECTFRVSDRPLRLRLTYPLGEYGSYLVAGCDATFDARVAPCRAGLAVGTPLGGLYAAVNGDGLAISAEDFAELRRAHWIDNVSEADWERLAARCSTATTIWVALFVGRAVLAAHAGSVLAVLMCLASARLTWIATDIAALLVLALAGVID